MVVHCIGGWLLVCGLWLVCKVGLGCHDAVQSYAMCKVWASGCWASAWTDASGLMGNYNVCAACG